MLRKEQFAFGVALIAAALAVILDKSLAWFILIIGLGLVFDFYLRDLIWGPDRLSREEIVKMPAEEYKARVLGNSKTESWVNWLTSGRDVFKKHMRKLAREAVIFMLVTPILAFAGDFGYLYHDAHKAVPVVPGFTPDTSNIPAPPPGFVPIPPGATIDPQPIDLSAGLVPKPTSELLILALWFGLYGIPAGFGFWVLYRAIRFAIKG